MSVKKKTGGAFALAQRLGRSLMLPIATLPAAGLLLRLGQADMLGAEGLAAKASWLQPVADIFSAAGGAVFDNLPLIFAVGVAVGFAKKADGSTGVAALFGFLVYRAVTWTMSPIIMGKPAPLSKEALDCLHSFDPATGKIAQVGPWNQGIKLCDIPTQTPINYGVLGGIVIGVVAALLWQRYYRVKLPDWLAFFGGRRFVPIVTSGAALVVALVMSALYPAFNWLINEQLGGWLINAGNSKGLAGALAVFVFGTVNRLLIPFGLHHLLNSVPWARILPDGLGRYRARRPDLLLPGRGRLELVDRRLHDRILPDHDVRPARSRAGHLAHRQARQAQGDRRPHDLGCSDRLHHRHHRTP